MLHGGGDEKTIATLFAIYPAGEIRAQSIVTKIERMGGRERKMIKRKHGEGVGDGEI